MQSRKLCRMYREWSLAVRSATIHKPKLRAAPRSSSISRTLKTCLSVALIRTFCLGRTRSKKPFVRQASERRQKIAISTQNKRGQFSEIYLASKLNVTTSISSTSNSCRSRRTCWSSTVGLKMATYVRLAKWATLSTICGWRMTRTRRVTLNGTILRWPTRT